MTILVSEEEEGVRLDRILSNRFPDYSRTYFQGLIEEELVLVNGKPTKKRIKPKEFDEVEVEFACTKEIDLSPEPIPLDVLYEDDHLLVVNKPAGMVVHPAPGHPTKTFVNALLYHCQNLEMGGERPGIVHRLDKDTSGALVAAKNEMIHRKLVALFASRQVNKEYLCIVVGNPGNCRVDKSVGRHPKKRQQMAVDVPNGRNAVTDITTIRTEGQFSLVQASPTTGRTHQIRVHLKSLQAPILGDQVYGISSMNEKLGVQRQLLHAHQLCFTHPVTAKPVQVRAPLPTDFQAACDKLSLGVL